MLISSIFFVCKKKSLKKIGNFFFFFFCKKKSLKKNGNFFYFFRKKKCLTHQWPYEFNKP